MKSCLEKMSLCFLATLLFLCQIVQAQQSSTITGTVTNKSTGEKIPGVTVTVKGTAIGAISDGNGVFRLHTTRSFPLTLVLSYVGFKTEELTVASAASSIPVQLTSTEILGQEVVVAASRVAESILQSPVSIEKLDARAIRNSPAPTFYDALANMKGVEMSTQSLTFKSVNTRGFNSNGNTRVLQLIDGMDNQAPGLNFSVGNIVGITELDMDNVELIPGAASALYGPNALNGIVLLNSKNPFLHQGLSANVKSGIMSDNGRSGTNTGYYDVTLRYAKAFNNKWAFKVNFGYVSAKDWQAYDKRDQSLLNGYTLENGSRLNPGYNGVNIYGDETNVNMKARLRSTAMTPGNPLSAGIQQISAATGGLLTPGAIYNAFMPDSSNAWISRTGYDERDVVDYNTKNIKINGALHYKINDNLEAFIQGSYGTGTTVYTGADRYALRNFRMGQYKAELKGSNFYVRAYTTQERSGESYAGGILAQGINEAWKPSTQWFQEYFGAYATAALGTFGQTLQQSLAAGQSPTQALVSAQQAARGGAANFHTNARNVADRGRLLPGTPEFDAASDKVKNKAIPGNAQGVGAKFTDKTNLYQLEFMYNFSNLINFAEILVGGNYRIYELNSEKTLFAVKDDGKEFRINEYGGYVQIAKRLFEEHVKVTGSLRYDKNENFQGQFSPRLSAVYTFLKTHNLRASYQTGFRIPHNQDQYIDLITPQAHLIGGLPIMRQRYGLDKEPVFTQESLQSGNPTPYQFREFKPEKIEAFELGYKGLFGNKLLIDAYAYYNNFKNFNAIQILIKRPGTAEQEVFSLPVNYQGDIKSWGWALGVDYTLPRNFVVGGNVSFNELTNANDLKGLIVGYNTPRIRYNLYVGNRNFGKSNIGANVTWRWQDSFVWESSFVGPAVRGASQSVVPAYGTLDAQVTKLFPSIKTTVKIGGANILRNVYTQAWGNPSVGAQYYASIGYNL
ncbi:TonB-dependent receptor [Chitinophaga pendula]|uniref:TonB-dependent receptor n=1 Tax=Chitinophaga TaxID=79328 RepID=UPI000BB04A5C|nr:MULTISPECIES: TonB-dependent receptor [Chitinophaga]ASZ13118.1 TonB-dependent receptor [Chitinophaga sp. MD30]UCJ09257.1 TonB-dependent receptor [Chitinophaga pendula]